MNPQPNSVSANNYKLPIEWGTQIKIGWLVLMFGFGGFLLWAVFAPLDKGVPVMGTVIVSGQRLSVQNPNPGVVDKIFIKEGAHVEANQLLMRMQPKIAEAVSDTSLANYALAMLTRERLLAEQSGSTSIKMPPQLLRYTSDKIVQTQFSTQQQLLLDRLNTKKSELAGLAETIRGFESQRSSILESKVSKQREQQLIDDQLARLSTLIEKGFASRAMLDETEIKRARLRSELADMQGLINRLASQIIETRLNIEKRQSEHQQEIKTLTLEAQRDIENFRGQLGAAQINLGYTDIKSPVAGNVLGLAITTPGSVLSAGTKLMDIVPASRTLVVEAQVPVNLIDQVRNDLDVELMFSAFQLNKTPRLTGKIRTVGADRIADPRTGIPYYPVNVSINAESLNKLGNNELRPGMPVDVFIKTGERTFLSYILKPVTDRIKGAMSED